MVLAPVHRRIIVAAVFVFLLGIFLALVVGLPLYTRWNITGAKAAVASAAGTLARGELPANVVLYDSVDRPTLTKAFGSGWQISGYDGIGVSLNAYEVMVRVPGGGQYNFDAARFDGFWHLTCCTHLSEADIQELEASRQR